MEKRVRPKQGFYKNKLEVRFERRRRSQPKREVLPELYNVERLVAKKKVGARSEYLVKWENYSTEQMTWEPEHHLPDTAIALFENPPTPQPEWIAEARERIAIALELGLKIFTQTDATLHISHVVLRHLFPRLPLELVSTAFEATEEDFAAAGLADFTERIVTFNGGRRKIDSPVFIKPFLGKAPAFRTAEGERSQQRKLEKVKLTFTKNC